MSEVVPLGNVIAPGVSALSGLFGAAKGVSGGIQQIAQGRAMFDADDARRLRRLQQLRRRGELGLNESERQRLEGQQAVERGGMLRTQQDQSNQAIQALANQDAVSGRDLFLAQVASQEAEAELRGNQAQAVAMQNMQARQQQQAELAQLKEQQRARQAAVRSGLTQALTLGLFGAGGAVVDEKIDAVKREQELERVKALRGRLSYGGRPAVGGSEFYFAGSYGTPGNRFTGDR